MDSPTPSPDIITTQQVELWLEKAFPGAAFKVGAALGRRRTYSLDFGEFSLSIIVPEESYITSDSTFTFRRRFKDKVLYSVTEKISRGNAAVLHQHILEARGYVLGIYVALQSVLESGPSEIADILGDG